MEDRRPGGIGQRAARLLSRLLTAVLVLGLVAAVAVLLSQINARTFTLEVEGRELVVRKGRLLPVGSEPFRPPEPGLAEAYAPLPLEGGANVSSLLGKRFQDRSELDQALFPVLAEQARLKLQAQEPEAVERGLYYLHRAELLTGLTEPQRRQLEELQAQAALHRAFRHLAQAGQQLGHALAELRRASHSGSSQAAEASRLLLPLEPAVRALEALLGSSKSRQASTQAPAHQAAPAAEPATGGSAPSP